MKAQVLANEALNAEVFRLELEKPDGFTFKPGQALQLKVPDVANPGALLDRYFSIASPPEKQSLELCIKKQGAATEYLSGLKAGESVELAGAVGAFVLEPKPHRHFVFVSMGTGVAPFRSMVASKLFRDNLPLSTLFLAGFRHAEDILFGEDLSRLDYIAWVPALSRESQDGVFAGRVTAYLKAAEIPFELSEFYICGSADLVKEVRAILEQKNVAEESIHHEAYLHPNKKKSW